MIPLNVSTNKNKQYDFKKIVIEILMIEHGELQK